MALEWVTNILDGLGDYLPDTTDWFSTDTPNIASTASNTASDALVSNILKNNNTPWYNSPQFWSAGLTSLAGIGSAVFGANANKDLRAQEAENSRYATDKQYELGMAKLAADKEAAAAAAGAASAQIALAKKKMILENFANYMNFMHGSGVMGIQQMNKTGEDLARYALASRSGAGARG